MQGKVQSKEKPELTMSQQFRITQPDEQDAIFVPRSDWERIKKKCGRIKAGGSVFGSIGFIFSGIAGTALVTALTLPQALESSRVICWVAFAISIVVATLSLYFSHIQSKELITSKDDVLEEMEYLEKKYKGQR